jgi:hypothetical protein
MEVEDLGLDLDIGGDRVIILFIDEEDDGLRSDISGLVDEGLVVSVLGTQCGRCVSGRLCLVRDFDEHDSVCLLDF